MKLSPREIDWNSIKIINRVLGKLLRKISEVFSIQKRKPVLSRDSRVEKSTV